jgi:hypothetical protein
MIVHSQSARKEAQTMEMTKEERYDILTRAVYKEGIVLSTMMSSHYGAERIAEVFEFNIERLEVLPQETVLEWSLDNMNAFDQLVREHGSVLMYINQQEQITIQTPAVYGDYITLNQIIEDGIKQFILRGGKI